MSQLVARLGRERERSQGLCLGDAPMMTLSIGLVKALARVLLCPQGSPVWLEKPMLFPTDLPSQDLTTAQTMKRIGRTKTPTTVIAPSGTSTDASRPRLNVNC